MRARKIQPNTHICPSYEYEAFYMFYMDYVCRSIAVEISVHVHDAELETTRRPRTSS